MQRNIKLKKKAKKLLLEKDPLDEAFKKIQQSSEGFEANEFGLYEN